jgi:transcriptional regulator with XRE-family HTH domain
MSTNQRSERNSEFYRGLHAKLIERRIFGAFFSLVQDRRKTSGLTRRQLAERMGRNETAVSRLMAGPTNWTLRTISELSDALGVQFEFRLVDQADPSVQFGERGKIAKNEYAHVTGISRIGATINKRLSVSAPPITVLGGSRTGKRIPAVETAARITSASAAGPQDLVYYESIAP